MPLFYEQKLGDSILRASGLAGSVLPKALLQALRNSLDRYFVTISADVKPDQPCARRTGGTGQGGVDSPPKEKPSPSKETPAREDIPTLASHCCDIKSVSAPEESFTANLEVSVKGASIKIEGGFTVKPMILNPTPLGNCPEECTNERVETAISFRFTFKLKINGSLRVLDAQPGVSSSPLPSELDLGPKLGKVTCGGERISGSNALTLDTFAIGGGAAVEFTGTDNLEYTITCRSIFQVVTKPSVGVITAGPGTFGTPGTSGIGGETGATPAPGSGPCDEPAAGNIIGDRDDRDTGFFARSNVLGRSRIPTRPRFWRATPAA